MLHITNGDSTVAGLEASGIGGVCLAWRDSLMDGPVPAKDSLEALSEIRAHALAEFGWGRYKQLRASFGARDRTLQEFRNHEEVVLWFEHDLYDQLQLLQLLAWFEGQDRGEVRLSLIQIVSHPEVKPFHCLGQLNGQQLAALFPTRVAVEPPLLAFAAGAWRAFCAPVPAPLVELLQRVPSEMPFLRDALMRFLEEYPSTSDGLSRSQRQLLRAVASGHSTKAAIYEASQAMEQCRWSDAAVYLRLDSLTRGHMPALARKRMLGIEQQPEFEYSLTGEGDALLRGERDWITMQGGTDVWLGGVHLQGKQAAWRLSDGEQRIVPG